MDSQDYDVFISYARIDNKAGFVSGLFDTIYQDFREFSSEPFKIFFDTKEIRNGDDWEHRLHQGLRCSRVLLVCLSPNYLSSIWCRKEWEEFTRLRARRAGGGGITGAYFVDLGGDNHYSAEVAAWRSEVERVQLEDLKPWFFDGVTALQDGQVRDRIRALGQGVHEQLSRAKLAKAAPGNLRRHNPSFVGRVSELRELRIQLSGGAVGVVTAVHGIGGMGKTELAVTYAHAYAYAYQGGTWQVDADGQTDMLEAFSMLALSPELGLAVGDEDLRDRHWLGRRVLARLAEMIDAARSRDPANAACLVLLDNVSEPELLSESQLAMLPEQPWLHLLITTRLGRGDVGTGRSRASVAMIEVGRLDDGDALTLIRDHQPARDPARLHPDFTSLAEEGAARQIVALLDGYTLAIEQAAVYLGATETEPSQLLTELQAHGVVALDEVGGAPEAAQAIRHKERLAGRIVDQTLHRLPQRAQAALRFACLLPPDRIPWGWLEELTAPAPPTTQNRLAGLSGDDWAATRRVLEGRRLLTPSDDARFTRLHRVVQAHLQSSGFVEFETEDRLDDHLVQVADALYDASAPDPDLLTVTASTLTSRLAAGSPLVVTAGLIVERLRQRLNSASTEELAVAAVRATEPLAAGESNAVGQSILVTSLIALGDVRTVRGNHAGALEAYNRALAISERLVATNPGKSQYEDEMSLALERVGDLKVARADPEGALELYARCLTIRERLVATNPGEKHYELNLSVTLNNVGRVRQVRGDPAGALDVYTRSLEIAERLAAAEPDNDEYQRGLNICLNRAGNARQACGDLTGALAAYTRSLAIAEQLVAADRSNVLYQQDLSITLSNVGQVREARGDTAGALQAYTSVVDITDRMVAADPENARYQRDLNVDLNNAGRLRAAVADLTGALEVYSRSLVIAERLAAADPNNLQYLNDLSFTRREVSRLQAYRKDPPSEADA